MGKTMNKVFIVGYAGGDAEQRTTQGGVKYARVSLSTSYGGYKKQDGTDVPERTQWHHCVAWNSLADTMGKYLKKGMKCVVTGRIEYGTYKNAQGVDIPTTEIVVEELTLMSQPQAQGVQPQQQPQPQQPQAQYQQGGYQQQPQPQQYAPPQQQPRQAQQPQQYGGYQQQGQQYGGYQQGAQQFPPNVNEDGLPF